VSRPFGLMLAVFFGGALLGRPIGFVMLGGGIAYLLASGQDVGLAGEQILNGLYSSYVLLAVPLFIFAANVMNAGTISERLFHFAHVLVGRLRGGLAHVNVVVGMFFAGISGSSTAEAAGIGSVFIPAMKKRGYDEKFSVCLTACTSTMGVVIPPSILMVVYGATAETSTGALLIGGILPGTLMGLALMVQSHLFTLKYDFPREHPRFLGMRAIWAGVKEGIWPLGVPVIIVGGMVVGIFTPTEAASVAAVYALAITLLLYRSLAWTALPRLFADTVVQFSQVLFCVAGASIFGWLLAFYQVPDLVTTFILSLTTDWRMIMLLIVLLYIILGTFMDAIPAILIFVPIIQPVALKVGIHPVHLGVVIVMTLALGLLTLPYGLCSLTACAVAGIPVTRILKLLHIMMIAIVVIIIVCALVPWTVLAIPRLLVPKWL